MSTLSISVVLQVVVGLISLLFGRRVFRLFIVLLGFVIGFLGGSTLSPESGTLVHILLGVGVGLIGVLLAKIIPVVITAIFGFIVGGAATVGFIQLFTPMNSTISLILFILGGSICIFLVVKYFNHSLAFLSSISGASTLASLGSDLFSYSNMIHAAVFIVLLVIGILVQFSSIHSDKKAE